MCLSILSIQYSLLVTCVFYFFDSLCYKFESICYIFCARRSDVFLSIYENKWKHEAAKDNLRSNKIVVIIHSFKTTYVVMINIFLTLTLWLSFLYFPLTTDSMPISTK